MITGVMVTTDGDVAERTGRFVEKAVLGSRRMDQQLNATLHYCGRLLHSAGLMTWKAAEDRLDFGYSRPSHEFPIVVRA